MKYARFEDLPVWKAAIEFKLRVDQFLAQPAVAPVRNFVDQLDRSSFSISNNIAEGFERGTTNELLSFLYIARGSAGEARSQLRYAERRPGWAELRVEIADLIGQAESISRQLRGWADALQNGDISGQRYLTEQTRQQYQQDRRGRQFVEQIRAEHAERIARMLTDRQAESGADADSESSVSGNRKS